MEPSTCTLALGNSWQSIHTIAYYSHLIPTFLALLLGFYSVFKTRFSKLALSFLLFVLAFSFWLVGDLFPWTSTNYNLVYFTWSWLDYVNIVFFVFGVYFFGVLARGRLSLWEKAILVAICVPAFLITVTGKSVAEFNQPVCEVIENSALTNYKLAAEGITIVMMAFSLFIGLRQSRRKKDIQLWVIFLAILLFFVVFSSTEFIATVTDIYEINLYGLFVLPVFLLIVVFAITNLRVFNLRSLGTQLLAYTLIIMVGSQFLFLEGSTDRNLNLITLVISIAISGFLLRNSHREELQLIEIRELADKLTDANARLKELDKAKTEFVSMGSHQLRSPLTAIKGYTSMILEGSFGEINGRVREALEVIFQSSQKLVRVIEDFLNVTRIELGSMKYDMGTVDLKSLVKQVVEEQKPTVLKRGLQLNFEVAPGMYNTRGDAGKLSQVVTNLVDNALKYTPAGHITVTLARAGDKSQIVVSDTGVGITPDVMPKLFQKFTRADDAGKVNVTGTGLGLYVAKQIIEAHGGKIWAESEGKGRGSKFVVEL